MFPSGY
jgi:hypothetical protein